MTALRAVITAVFSDDGMCPALSTRFTAKYFLTRFLCGAMCLRRGWVHRVLQLVLIAFFLLLNDLLQGKCDCGNFGFMPFGYLRAICFRVGA